MYCAGICHAVLDSARFLIAPALAFPALKSSTLNRILTLSRTNRRMFAAKFVGAATQQKIVRTFVVQNLLFGGGGGEFRKFPPQLDHITGWGKSRHMAMRFTTCLLSAYSFRFLSVPIL